VILICRANVLFSRAGHGTNREAPPTGHGVGWNNGLEAIEPLQTSFL
jgi:hypothetical protein